MGQLISSTIKDEGPYLGPFAYELGVQEIVGSIVSVDAAVVASTTAIVAAIEEGIVSTIAATTAAAASIVAALASLHNSVQPGEPILTGRDYNWTSNFNILPGFRAGKVKFESLSDYIQTVVPGDTLIYNMKLTNGSNNITHQVSITSDSDYQLFRNGVAKISYNLQQSSTIYILYLTPMELTM